MPRLPQQPLLKMLPNAWLLSTARRHPVSSCPAYTGGTAKKPKI